MDRVSSHDLAPEEALPPEALRLRNQLLHDLVSQSGCDFNVQVRRALARTAQLLGLDQGVLARVTEDACVIEHAHGPDDEGRVIDLEGANCSAALEANGLVAAACLDEAGLEARRCYEKLALASYVGTPVFCNEQLYGVLAFSGAEPRRAPFTEADRSLVRLLGRWVEGRLEQQATDEAQRKKERRLRLLAENVSDMVCLHGLDGQCIYVSPSAERLLGYAPEELVGVSPLDIAHPDDAGRIQAAALRAVRGEADVTETIRLRHKDGSYHWCETAGHPVYAASGGRVEHFLTSTRDVSERVETEEDLERANAELRLRNRELQDFAHIASHDLQEPLRKVRAFAELMREDYEEQVDEDGRYYLERMQDGAERMARLVSDLLSLSRVTTKGHPFEEVDLEEIVTVVRTDLEMRIEETDGRVEVGALPRLEADPVQMRQLLQNLIGNALKFHREGTPPVVQVRGTREAAAAPPDGIATSEHVPPAPRPIEQVRIVVEDNGIGFEEKFLDRIFTPLQRLHGRDDYAGTGIGLAVCNRIAERHGGTIQAESTPGAGSRFTVLLPAEQTREDDPDAAFEESNLAA